MKAAQITNYGSAEEIKIVDVDKPVVADGQVGVEVHAASLNPFDTMVREGYVKDAISSLPVTLGGDFAGVVREVGAGVTNVAVGDKVYGQANVVAGNSGAFAEYVVTSASQVSQVPSNTDFQQAAALPLVGSSAWQALHEHIGLKSGQTILIHGSGGIGLIAVQIAKQIGANVTATVRSSEQAETAKGFGADQVIDTTDEELLKHAEKYDAVFDTVGGEEFAKTFHLVKPGGTAVSMLGNGQDAPEGSQIKTISQSTHVTSEKLAALRELVEDGSVKPQIGKVFVLADVTNAFKARETGGINGKVVLAIHE